MADHPRNLNDRVDELERSIASLERRLAAIESLGAVLEAPAEPDLTEQAAVEPPPVPVIGGPSAGALTLTGRTSVVLGGAFLLRALTESGRVPVAVGVSIGFAYALLWLGAAYRAGDRGRASAFFHGLASVVIALPLVFEAVARFGAYGTWTSAVLLGLAAAFGLFVATRHRLPALAAIVVLGTLVTAGSLAIVTTQPVPFAVLSAGLACLVTVMAEPARRSWMQWPIAFFTNVLVLAIVARAGGPAPLAPAGESLAGVVVFVAAYVWVIAYPLLGRNRQLGVFDVLQAMPLVLLGLAGLMRVAAAVGPAVGLVFSLVTLLAGVACYAIGLGLSSDRPHRLPAVHFFTSAAIAIVLVGATSLVDGVGLTLLFAGLGFVFSWLGARRLQPTFLLHGAVYVLAAAATLGVFGALGAAWLMPIQTWPTVSPLLWLVAAAAALGVLGPRLAAGDLGGDLTVAARTTNATTFTAVAATWVLVTAGPMLAASPDPGAAAALRSVALAIAAVSVAAAGRVNRARAFGRLAYPLIALGAIKLLIEDFWQSGPVMVFVALAAFGVALILTTRLRGRR